MPSRFVVPESGLALRSGTYPWAVLVAAFLSCLATLAAYSLWGTALALQLVASPLSVQGDHDDFGASAQRAGVAGLSEPAAGTTRVFLLGSSFAAAAFARPEVLSDALAQAGAQKVEVVLLAHRGQTAAGTVALASLARVSPRDVIVLGVTDFDLLGTRFDRIGSFDVFGRLMPTGTWICQIRQCPANEIFLLQRSARAIIGNLVTGRRPAPVSGLQTREEATPLLSVQRERLLHSLAENLRTGVDPERVAEAEAMLQDLEALAPGRVVAVRLPVSPDLQLSDRQAGMVGAGQAALRDSLAKAGVRVIPDLAEARLSSEDFSDVLHVWPDVSPHLMQDVLAPALRPILREKASP